MTRVPCAYPTEVMAKQQDTPVAVSRFCLVGYEWAWEELNFRPHAYQSALSTRGQAQLAKPQRLPLSRHAAKAARSAPEIGGRAYPARTLGQSSRPSAGSSAIESLEGSPTAIGSLSIGRQGTTAEGGLLP